MEPLRDQLKELRELPNPTDEQKAEMRRLTDEVKSRITTHDEFVAGYQDALAIEQKADGLRDAPLVSRAQYDVPSHAKNQDTTEVKGWFDHLVETEGFRRASKGNGLFQASVPLESLYPFETKAAFAVTNPALLTGPMPIYNQFTTRNRHPVLDLVPTVQDARYTIPYLPMTFTNSAIETAWGAPKIESTNAGTIQTLTQVTIAHWKRVIRQQLHYLPGLRAEVEAEMGEGVLRRLELQIIQGTGVSPLLSGLLTQATLAATGADLVQQIMDAIATVETNGGIVDAILVNPSDYQKLITYQWLANTFNSITNNGGFAGYRVVKSSAMPAGKALVGDWEMAVQLYVGDALNISATELVEYINNIVTLRAEMDAVIHLKRPWLMVECTGARPAPPPAPPAGFAAAVAPEPEAKARKAS